MTSGATRRLVRDPCRTPPRSTAAVLSLDGSRCHPVWSPGIGIWGHRSPIGSDARHRSTRYGTGLSPSQSRSRPMEQRPGPGLRRFLAPEVRLTGSVSHRTRPFCRHSGPETTLSATPFVPRLAAMAEYQQTSATIALCVVMTAPPRALMTWFMWVDARRTDPRVHRACQTAEQGTTELRWFRAKGRSLWPEEQDARTQCGCR